MAQPVRAAGRFVRSSFLEVTALSKVLALWWALCYKASGAIMQEPTNTELLDVAAEAVSSQLCPRFHETPEQLDLDLSFLTDLALKTLSTDANGTTSSVSERMKLGLVIPDTVLQRLYRENLIEMKGSIAMH